MRTFPIRNLEHLQHKATPLWWVGSELARRASCCFYLVDRKPRGGHAAAIILYAARNRYCIARHCTVMTKCKDSRRARMMPERETANWTASRKTPTSWSASRSCAGRGFGELVFRLRQPH